MDAILWLIIFIVFIFIEIMTLGLTTIWFACGSIAGFVCALLNVDYKIQILVALVVSIIMLVLTRPFAKKMLIKENEKTNIDGIIGKIAVVDVEIDNISAKGDVILNGEKWKARSNNNEIIKKDERVRIVNVEGIKLIVQREN